MSTRRLLLLASAFASVVPALASAQILRPSRITDSSRVLTVAPQLAGFRVGEPLLAAVARLGTGLKVDTLVRDSDDPIVSYANVPSGIKILGTTAGGVGSITITAPSTGRLDEVRIGASRAAVVAHWGSPAADGRVRALWFGRDYVVVVAFDEVGQVNMLELSRWAGPRPEE